MKILLLLLLLFTSIQNLQSQTKDEITYSEGELYKIYQNEKPFKTISEIPFAKVRSVIYNSFYKSFVFLLTTEEGATGFTLKYVKDNTTFPGETIMVDKNNDLWSVANEMDKNGKLFLLKEKAENGILTTYKFVNLVKD